MKSLIACASYAWPKFLLAMNIVFLSHGVSFAQEAFKDLGFPRPDVAGWDPYAPFLAPNENSPALMKSIVSKSNGGLYVAVGTDRGFMGAALSGSDRLLLIDRDNTAVLFNKINVALLRMSKKGKGGREDYLHLRLNATPEELIARAASSSLLNAEQKKLLSDKTLMESFKQSLTGRGFQRFHQASDNLNAFGGANYLYDDRLFGHVQNLAKQGRIEAHQVDWQNKTAIDKIVVRIKDRKIPLGVVDVSNAWEFGFIKQDSLEYLMKGFSSAGQKESLFLFTSATAHRDVASMRYFALSADYVSRQPAGSTAEFFQFLHNVHGEKMGMPEVIFDRIDGLPSEAAVLGKQRLPLASPERPYGQYKSSFREDSVS